MKNKTFLLTFSFLLLTLIGKAQDDIFTQFYNAPLLINPSLTGHINSDRRIVAGYKNQLTTSTLSINNVAGFLTLDTKKQINSQQYIGFGASAYFDRQSTNNFGNNEFMAYGSFNKYFGDKTKKHHLLSMGFDLGLANTGFTFQNKTYFDLGAGINWSYKTPSKFGFQLGTSISHLTKPNISIFGGNQRLNRTFNIHGSVCIPMTKKVHFSPVSLLIFSGTSQLQLVGINGTYYFSSEESKHMRSMMIGISGWSGVGFLDPWRIYTSNFIGSVAFNRFSIGISYDHFIKRLESNLEVIISYRFNRKQRG